MFDIEFKSDHTKAAFYFALETIEDSGNMSKDIILEMLEDLYYAVEDDCKEAL